MAWVRSRASFRTKPPECSLTSINACRWRTDCCGGFAQLWPVCTNHNPSLTTNASDNNAVRDAAALAHESACLIGLHVSPRRFSVIYQGDIRHWSNFWSMLAARRARVCRTGEGGNSTSLRLNSNLDCCSGVLPAGSSEAHPDALALNFFWSLRFNLGDTAARLCPDEGGVSARPRGKSCSSSFYGVAAVPVHW